MSTETALAGAAVGHERAVAHLARVLVGTDGSSRGGILLTGHRGLGRTTVLNAALASLDPEPVRMLGVRCQERRPYASLTHVLGSVAGHPDFGPTAELWLEVLASAEGQSAHVVAPQLLACLPVGGWSRGPLVHAVDDVHHYDRQSQDVVAYLAHSGGGSGLRMLLSADETADLSAFAPLERLRLQPLPVEHVRTLLESAHDHPVPHRVANLLHRWSGGNPTLALDLARQLSEPQLAGTSPVALPLVPSDDLQQRLGEQVRELPLAERRLLAHLAQRQSFSLDQLPIDADGVETLLDAMVSGGWLSLQGRTVRPRRRLDALLAYASLAPSEQHELHLQLARRLADSAPAAADYFFTLAGVREAAVRVVDRAWELYHGGDHELAASACALALQAGAGRSSDQEVLLAQLLTADGYVAAVHSQLRRLTRNRELAPAARAGLLASLSAMTGDLSEASAQIDVSDPPETGLDEWLQAVLLLCRVQLGHDGPEESRRLVQGISEVLERASGETRALAAVVTAERAVYTQEPGSASELARAIEEWRRQRSPKFDLATMSAVVDLLGLGQLVAARDLLSTAGSLAQLPFATERTALLTLRLEADIAAGHFRRAAGTLVRLDQERPNLSGSDLLTTSQAVRISTVCDDLEECAAIERRLARSSGVVLSYPARREHLAALGLRELVRDRWPAARDLLTLALHGPALLLQGRSAVLADLVEALVATGDRLGAAQALGENEGLLPDLGGDRTAGLLARCSALLAPADDVDAAFERALAEIAPTYEVDRARTLLAYGRTLVLLGRPAAAQPHLTRSLALFSGSLLPGWEAHVRRLQLRCTEARAAGSSAEVSLTEMEQQVLALVMQRKRNREIAAQLYVSLRTVEGHLTRIFRKLGVSTKMQLYRQVSAQRSPLSGRAPEQELHCRPHSR